MALRTVHAGQADRPSGSAGQPAETPRSADRQWVWKAVSVGLVSPAAIREASLVANRLRARFTGSLLWPAKLDGFGWPRLFRGERPSRLFDGWELSGCSPMEHRNAAWLSPVPPQIVDRQSPRAHSVAARTSPKDTSLRASRTVETGFALVCHTLWAKLRTIVE
jgi:hypothetical protein